jgi:hypothetical protein
MLEGDGEIEEDKKAALLFAGCPSLNVAGKRTARSSYKAILNSMIWKFAGRNDPQTTQSEFFAEWEHQPRYTYFYDYAWCWFVASPRPILLLVNSESYEETKGGYTRERYRIQMVNFFWSIYEDCGVLYYCECLAMFESKEPGLTVPSFSSFITFWSRSSLK